MELFDIIQIGIAVLGGIGGILIVAGFVVRWLHGKRDER